MEEDEKERAKQSSYEACLIKSFGKSCFDHSAVYSISDELVHFLVYGAQKKKIPPIQFRIMDLDKEKRKKGKDNDRSKLDTTLSTKKKRKENDFVTETDTKKDMKTENQEISDGKSKLRFATTLTSFEKKLEDKIDSKRIYLHSSLDRLHNAFTSFLSKDVDQFFARYGSRGTYGPADYKIFLLPQLELMVENELSEETKPLTKDNSASKNNEREQQLNKEKKNEEIALDETSTDMKNSEETSEKKGKEKELPIGDKERKVKAKTKSVVFRNSYYYSVQKWLGIIRLPKQPQSSFFSTFSPKVLMNSSSIFDTSSEQSYEYKYVSFSNQAYKRLLSIQFQENYNTLGYNHLVRLDYDFPGTFPKITQKVTRPFSIFFKRDKIDLEILAKFFLEERYKSLVDMLLDIKSRDENETDDVLSKYLRLYLTDEKNKKYEYNMNEGNSKSNSSTLKSNDNSYYEGIDILTGTTIHDDEKFDSDSENRWDSNTQENKNSSFIFRKKGRNNQNKNKTNSLEESGLEMDLFAIGVENKTKTKNCRYVLSKDVEAYQKRISDLERQIMVMKSKIREDELG